MSCGVCPQGSGWDAQRATWILGKWSIGRERNQQERKRSRCAKCLIGYVVVWNMLVGHLFIYLAGTFFLSESYNFIYWSVPFQVHICICYRIWNILIIVLSQARLCCFSSPSHIPLFYLLTGLFPSTHRYIICYGIWNILIIVVIFHHVSVLVILLLVYK